MTARELARAFRAKWPNARVDEESMRGWFQLAIEQGSAEPAIPAHSWTPDETKNKCTVCGDGPWGRHRFAALASPPVEPRASQEHPLQKNQCRERHHSTEQRCELEAGHSDMHNSGDYVWPNLSR